MESLSLPQNGDAMNCPREKTAIVKVMISGEAPSLSA